MRHFAVGLALIFACFARAQNDEAVELSPFSISSEYDRGYVPQQPAKPDVAVTLRKPASAVVMEVSLLNAADKPEDRNREIYATIKDIEDAAKRAKDVRFERREIQLRGESRRKLTSFLSKSGSATSVATIALVSDLTTESDLFDLVRRMRGLVSSVTPAGSTKIMDGTVALMIRDPDQYRRELLAKIFDDVEFVKKGLGSGFEVLLSGLDGPIQVRPCSDKEVELWINYHFSIRSLVELQNPRPAKN